MAWFAGLTGPDSDPACCIGRPVGRAKGGTQARDDLFDDHPLSESRNVLPTGWMLVLRPLVSSPHC